MHITELFPLREKELEIRGKKVRVRELTQEERETVFAQTSADSSAALRAFAAAGCIEPKFTIEEAKTIPAEVTGLIATEVMRLCGLKPDEKTEGGETKND